MTFTAATQARIAVATVLIAVLTGCDVVFPPPEDRSPRIDIYTDHYEYRHRRYESVRSLRIGLEAVNEPIARLIVQECEARSRLPEVIDMLRGRDNFNVAVIVAAEDCATE